MICVDEGGLKQYGLELNKVFLYGCKFTVHLWSINVIHDKTTIKWHNGHYQPFTTQNVADQNQRKRELQAKGI